MVDALTKLLESGGVEQQVGLLLRRALERMPGDAAVTAFARAHNVSTRPATAPAPATSTAPATRSVR